MPIASKFATDFCDTQEGSQPAARVYIVGPNMPQNQLLCTCLSTSLQAVCSCHAELPETVQRGGADERPCIFLLDCLACEVEAIAKHLALRDLSKAKPAKVVLFNVDKACRLEGLVRAFKIQGVFYREDSRSLFLKGMRAIMQGELWLGRQLLTRCVLTSRQTCPPFWGSTINDLSLREKEILCLVVEGASNQEIADLLKISVHTVKTHLYNVYKKIEVPNRLQAALWATTYLQRERPRSA